MISLHNMLPFELTKDTPYLALSGELWSVFYEYFNRNWSCYKGFLLYFIMIGVNPPVPVKCVEVRAWMSNYALVLYERNNSSMPWTKRTS